LPSHAAPPCCCLAVAAALEHQGTASTYACTRACHGHVRRALHTRPDPAARLTLGFACRGALVAVAALRVATAMPSATGTPRASRLRTPAHRTRPQGHALRSPSFTAGPRPCRTPHAHELTTPAVSHALGRCSLSCSAVATATVAPSLPSPALSCRRPLHRVALGARAPHRPMAVPGSHTRAQPRHRSALPRQAPGGRAHGRATAFARV